MKDTKRKLAWDSLRKNTLVDHDTIIDKITGEFLGPEVDYTCNKQKFRLIL